MLTSLTTTFLGLAESLGFSAHDLYVYAGSSLVLFLVCAIAWKMEHIRPIEVHDTAEARGQLAMEYKLALGNFLLRTLIAAPIAVSAQLMILRALGGGGWLFLESPNMAVAALYTCVYLLAMELHKYWIHRISHRVPALWAIHSFHHSARRITFITGARHSWLETLAFIPFSTVLALCIDISPSTLLAASVLFSVPEMFVHLNYKTPWTPLHYVVTNPQWHRIHHSVQPEHMDKNFAATLPVMDFLFGTACVPAPDEFPDTGLAPDDAPGFVDGMLWPFRGVVREWLGASGTEETALAAAVEAHPQTEASAVVTRSA